MSQDAWLAEAVAVLQAGKVLAYPTEAVWGLGCDPWNQKAVDKIFAIKGRQADKGLILTAFHSQQIYPLLKSLSRKQLRQVMASWPGPVTWLLPDPDNWVPKWIKGQHQKVAVRISAHPRVRLLSAAFAKPMVSTSANLSGTPPARTFAEAQAEFSKKVPLLVPGEVLGYAKPSTICDSLSGSVLR